MSTNTTYDVFCLSEALSPITHMSGNEGNESLVMREPVVTPEGVRWVPSLSGNSLRHKLVREPGARYLVDRWGLSGKLTLGQLNYLFHGGNLTEGGGRENTRRIADMQRLFPLTRLIGGSLPDQILAGSLHVWRGTLACRENAPRLMKMLPDGWGLPAGDLRPAEAFVEGYQYTRGDATKSIPDMTMSPEFREASSLEAAKRGDRGRWEELVREADPPERSNLMIFAGQSVIAGAMFVHGFRLPHVSALELGALLCSLRLWTHAGGVVGGQSARGHGRLTMALHVAPSVDQDELVAAYVAHVDAAKDEAVAWLMEAFAPPKTKPGKGKAKPAEPTEAAA